MYETYHFDGTTECRGRNGWFQLHEMHLLTGPGLDDTPRVYVDLYSKIHAKNAPIQLRFTNADELRRVICGLAKALYAITEEEEERPDAE